MVRLSLREALQRSRSLVRSRGHDWDIADVMAVINESDTEDEAGDVVIGERMAVLTTGTDLRRAALEAITLLTQLTDLPEHATLVIQHVINLLDVPEAGDSLPRLSPHAPHYGRETRHPLPDDPPDVYPPPRDRDDPDDIGHE